MGSRRTTHKRCWRSWRGGAGDLDGDALSEVLVISMGALPEVADLVARRQVGRGTSVKTVGEGAGERGKMNHKRDPP